ncbi:preprotein translocase subunit YajC [Microbacterium sp. gxy059]|uniref:preprotein translocase subunit YajC n=1 Tax=Microbacterium sp. gxy059 TaxID=2957199 RepID=UPI003D99BBD8
MDIALLVVAGGLIVMMIVSSNRRRKKMQEEEEKRQRSLLPGAPVMTRAGLYGTLVSFDAEDLTKRAVIEIAPGVEVEVHAQTVVIDPDAQLEDEPVEAEDEAIEDDETIEVPDDLQGLEELEKTDRPADDEETRSGDSSDADTRDDKN